MDKEKLYIIISNIDEISTKKLKENGVSEYYIYKFVKESILVREKKGKYKLKNFNNFYSFGKKMLKEKNIAAAIKIFDKCKNIDANFIPAYFQRMIANILQANFNDVLLELDYLSNNNVINENERAYMLYLLSNVIDLPKIYKNELEFFTFESIRYNNLEDKNAYTENVIRGLCYKMEFEKAFVKSKKQYNSVYNTLHYYLLQKIIIKYKNIDKLIYNLIDEEKYDEILILLEKNNCNNTKYQYIKTLINEIISIEQKGVLPKTKITNADSVYEAINGKNYSLALYLCKYNSLIKDLLIILNNKIKTNVKPNLEIESREKLNYFTKINKDNYYLIEKEIDYINKLLIKKRGVYVMECFNDETTSVILNILTLYPNIKVSLIDYNLESRIVLRYCPVKQEIIDISNSFVYANYYYKYRNYKEALEKCLDILQTENPSLNAYLLAANIYIKLKKTNDAKNCFMIADFISKRSKYKEIVAYMENSEYKGSFEMDISEFYETEEDIRTKKK